jgi:hypothetical protein
MEAAIDGQSVPIETCKTTTTKKTVKQHANTAIKQTKKENAKQTSSVPRTLVALPPNLCQATVPRQGLETLAPASAGII